MGTYLLLDLIVLLPPLLGLIFYRYFWTGKKFIHAVFSIFPVATVFLAWDVIAATIGDWQFNPSYVLPTRILSLPIEEYLFFFIVPLACLFIYESVRYLVKYAPIHLHQALFIFIACIFLGISFFYWQLNYTRTVMLWTSATCLLLYLTPQLSRQRAYWITIALSYIGFYIMNGFLTGLPVITYAPDAITGIRIGTIPIEDHLYSFALITFTLFRYTKGGTS